MIKTISYWSITGGLENTRPIEEALAEAKKAGFQGFEAAVGTSGVLTPSTDQKTCEGYRKAAEKHGMVMETLASGMSWGFSPSHPDPAIRQKGIKLHQDAIQRAAWIGAKAMLFVPGAVKIPWDANYAPVPYEKAYAWAKEAITQVAASAEKAGVDLCVENVWNGLCYSPMEFAGLIDSIGSKRVFAYFDAGNVLGYQQHPPHWISYLGKRIKRVHIKDFKLSVGNLSGFCDLLDGDVPWKETMAALKAIGYNSTIVAEMIPPTPGILERTSKAMDKILAM